MAQQQINIGATANDGTGDTIRTAFDKVNQNFTEVYGNIDTANSVEADAAPKLGGDLDVAGYSIVGATGTGVISILPSTSGYARIDGITIDGTVISTFANNTNFTLDPQGTGKVLSNKIAFTGGTLDNVTIGGVTPATGTFDVLTVNNALQATGGNIDAVTIGSTTAAAAKFTLVEASEIQPNLIRSKGHVLPNVDISYDLGSNTLKWRTLYANSVNANNINLTGTITGTFAGNVTGNVTGNLTGNVTGDVTGDVTGNLTGNVTGNLAGNVTGDVTGNLTGNVTGNADTATALETPRTINGVSFDGTANIVVTADTTNSLSFGTGLVLGSFNGSSAETVEVDTTVMATKAFVTDEITNVVGLAPEALNTLQELAAALGDDADFAGTITSALASKLDLAGGTMTGSLILLADPTATLEAATKGYVDAQISAGVSSASSISSDNTSVSVVDTGVADGAVNVTVDGTLIATFGPASLNMNSKRIISLADPSGNQDAATKKYVDDGLSSLAAVAHSGSYLDLVNAPSLAYVATSGSYLDLADKPSLASVAISGTWYDLNDRPDLVNFVATTVYANDSITAAGSVLAPDIAATNTILIGNLSGSSTGTIRITGTGIAQQRAANLTISANSGQVLIQGLTYPKVDGTAGQALVTDGAGLLSWASMPSLTGYATEAYVDAAVAALVDSAPATLDTLEELAAALGDDANFATTVSTQIGLKANTADLAAVATSGAYSDLTGAPTLATVATSGDYNDLVNQPAIPADVSDLTDTTNLLFSGDHADLTGIPRFPVYADATARDAAIPTPALGMVVITNSALEFYNGTSWTAL